MLHPQSTKLKKRRAQTKWKENQQNKFSYLQEDLENTWALIAGQISSVLANDITLPEEEHPLPFDAVSDKSLEEQK